MDSKTVNKIRDYLIDCGQSDRDKFNWGDPIMYTPSKVADLLKKMPEDKPPLGARPFETVFSERIGELAEAIARCSDNCTKNADAIKLWSQEIEELCNIIWYLKQTKEEMNNG